MFMNISCAYCTQNLLDKIVLNFIAILPTKNGYSYVERYVVCFHSIYSQSDQAEINVMLLEFERKQQQP